MTAGAFLEDRLLTAEESESLLHLMYTCDVAGEVWSGGSAIVRRARRLTDDTEVVLKLLSPSSADEEREVLEEARVLRRLCHENVVRLLDSFATPPDGVSSLTIPRRCLVLEACECSLEDDVRSAWPGGVYEREEEVLTSRALDLCRGLNYVHKHGVAHRDLKAANVLLQDGVLKLADFGSAQQGESRSSEAAGTVGYLAPELTRSDAYDASQRGMQLADRWALGIVLCELATGRLVHEWPWAGRNLASARRREKWDVISAAAAHCPAAAEVASRLLRQAPGRRIVLSKAMRLLAPPRAAPELSDGESTQSDTDERPYSTDAEVARVAEQLNSKDEDRRRRAAERVGYMGSVLAQFHIARLKAMLESDPSMAVRTTVAKTFGELGVTAFSGGSALCKALRHGASDDDAYNLRSAAAKALGCVFDARARREEWHDVHLPEGTIVVPMPGVDDARAAIDALVDAVCGDAVADVRRAAAHALRRVVEGAWRLGTCHSNALRIRLGMDLTVQTEGTMGREPVGAVQRVLAEELKPLYWEAVRGGRGDGPLSRGASPCTRSRATAGWGTLDL